MMLLLFYAKIKSHKTDNAIVVYSDFRGRGKKKLCKDFETTKFSAGIFTTGDKTLQCESLRNTAELYKLKSWNQLILLSKYFLVKMPKTAARNAARHCSKF